LAASVAALPPPESVPVAGGPTTPVATVKDVDKFPLASVVLRLLRGLEQETGIALPAKSIVG